MGVTATEVISKKNILCRAIEVEDIVVESCNDCLVRFGCKIYKESWDLISQSS